MLVYGDSGAFCLSVVNTVVCLNVSLRYTSNTNLSSLLPENTTQGTAWSRNPQQKLLHTNPMIAETLKRIEG